MCIKENSKLPVDHFYRISFAHHTQSIREGALTSTLAHIHPPRVLAYLKVETM
jgi:hypothetical protein